MKTMSIQDSFWTWIEAPATPMQVAALSIFHPDEPATDVVHRIVEEYRSYPATSRPFNYLIHTRTAPLLARREVIDDVDIDYHLRHSALPRPGGERELGVLVSRLHSTPLDPRRPMWEAHVIEGLAGNRFAVYLKAHHSLMDGVAGIRILAETFSREPDAPLPPPPWARELPVRFPKAAAPSPKRGWLRGAGQVPRAVRTIARATRQPDNPLVGPYQAPKSPINVPISPQRRVATARIEQSRVAAIAEATGTTLNDVVLALCSTALRRYLLAQKTLPDDPLVAMCPVSVRPADSDGDGNAVSMLLANLATDDADPLARLRTIAASTRAGKDHLRSMDAKALGTYSPIVMGPQLGRQLIPGVAATRPLFNLVISNVPGPRRPRYLGGARMEAFYPMSLLFKNDALNITLLSYDSWLNFGLTACRVALPHMQDIAVFLVDALAELESA